MSSRRDNNKKRPPAIDTTGLPLPRLSSASDPMQQSEGSEQAQQPPQWQPRTSSKAAQHSLISTKTTPMASPREQGMLPRSKSQHSKTTNQPGSLKSAGQSSAGSSQLQSSTQSRRRQRSMPGIDTAQAEQYDFGEWTSRGEIESKNEMKLFKKTGQLPPTPIRDTAAGDAYIRREDLRAQCRAANATKSEKPSRDNSTKSPKKKMFGINFNLFNRHAEQTPTPSMPPKAAQVLGTAPRNPTIIAVRPIIPALPLVPPSLPKSRPAQQSKSLSKKASESNTASGHRRTKSMHHMQADRVQPQNDEPPVPRGMSLGLENNPAVESMRPPTPPAKDTPPEPGSPLRRTRASVDLRVDYGGRDDNGMSLRYPEFALSPANPDQGSAYNGSDSPTFQRYTAADYTNLIQGENVEALYTLRAARSTGEEHRDNHSKVGPTLEPRFYSPSLLSASSFAEGETPSKNTDINRLLFKTAFRTPVFCDSSSGSIDMMYQGDGKDINPQSSTAQVFNTSDQQALTPQARDIASLTMTPMHNLRFGEQQTVVPHRGLMPDQSSSRLTDMLRRLDVGRTDSINSFAPNCPSAVPSPLHRTPAPPSHTQSPAFASGATPRTPMGPVVPIKTMEDHFYMTNEHLDVVGKTTWDLLEAFKKEQSVAIDSKHKELLGLVNTRFEEFRLQMKAGHEKADQDSKHHDSTHDKLDNLVNLIQKDIIAVLETNNKKTLELEAHIKDLQQAVQGLQKSQEQKMPEVKTAGQQQVTTDAFAGLAPPQGSLPALRSQPSIGGWWQGTDDMNRNPGMLHAGIHDGRNVAAQESPNEARGGYNNGYGQRWGGRGGYGGRNNGKEGRSPYATNPYQFASGGPFNNGYNGGYSSYNYSPASPDDSYGFGQAPAKQ